MRLRADKREQRKVEATERVVYWRGLSGPAKVASLDRRLGVNVGAKRQRAKLG